MQPLSYLASPVGIVWVIMCIPLGFALTALGYYIINHVPAKWLCDYNETPSEELLSGKRVKYLPWGIAVSILISACLVLCRLQFNKGYDIYFCLLSLIIFDCLLIAIADIKYKIIPDQFTIFLGIVAAAISVYDIVRGYNILHCAWWSPLAGAGIGAAAMIIIDLIGMIVYKRDGMGFGDVKLFFAGGILTGFPGTITAFIISILTAAVFFVAIIIISKIVCRNASESPEPVTQDANEGAAGQAVSEEAVEQLPTESDTEGTDDAQSDEPDLDEENGEEDDGAVDLGSYLAFGPYIAAALVGYVVLFDLINYLVQLYLNLF